VWNSATWCCRRLSRSLFLGECSIMGKTYKDVRKREQKQDERRQLNWKRKREDKRQAENEESFSKHYLQHKLGQDID